MRYDKLTVRFDDSDDWVILESIALDGKVIDQGSCELPTGFTLEQVESALLATGWVERRDSGYVLVDEIACQSFADTLAEMLRYVDASGAPSAKLGDVRAAAEHYLEAQVLQHIPLWALAWLDVMVRGDVADAARSVENLWSQPQVIINIEPHARQRFTHLATRYAAAADAPRQAPARRRRSSRDPGKRMGG